MAVKINSKAYTGTGRDIAKGLAAGTLLVNNDRQYGAIGIMNETDFTFNTNFFGKA